MHDTSETTSRVALYCRVSTEEQREGQTIESQTAELEKFAADKGWTVVGTYKDDGWSGSLIARPELDRLRDDASKALFQAVLINDVDRLARDVTHLGVIKRDLERHGVRVVFRKLPGEQSPTQNLLVNILGSFAEFEKELIADRTRRGKRHKVEVRKEYLGSCPPYGFRYVPKQAANSEPGRLEIIPEEAEVVRRMYAWVDEDGLSAQKVVSQLNRLGVSAKRGGYQWQKSTVRRVLRNEIYAGVWHYNKHRRAEPRRTPRRSYRKSPMSSTRLRPKSEWLPVPLPEALRIVDRVRWSRVQEQINRNIIFSPRNSRHEYLLRGLVRCGACKAAYVGEPSHGRFAYRCSKRCKAYSSIREQYLNDTVWNAVAYALQNPQVILEGVKSIVTAREAASSTGVDTDLGKKMAQIGVEEARVVEAYRLEVLSAEQLARELAALKQRRMLLASLNADRSAEKKSLPRRSLEQYCEIASQRIKTLDWPKRRIVLRQLLKEILFEGTRVRIAGVISLPQDFHGTGNATPTDSPLTGNAVGIAITTSSLCGRNPDAELQSYQTPQEGRLQVDFELVGPVARIKA
jgi:site-specific DNA recombinase